MSQDSERPPVTIELLGPHPRPGQNWCATCATLYLGEVSADPDVQEAAQKKVQEALDKGWNEVILSLPPSWRKLREAITIAPSVYFPYPLPVCWVHLQGAKPGGQPVKSELIKGKKH